MDPEATVDLWLDAMEDQRLEDVLEHEEDYREWRRKGGFAAQRPDGSPIEDLAYENPEAIR